MENGKASSAGLSFKYALIQSFYWMSFAILIGYSSNYLLGIGFNSEQVGIMVAIAGLVSAVMQPVVASFVDRKAGHALKNTIMVCSVILLASAGVLLMLHGHSLWGAGIIYASAIGLLQLLTALINALGMNYESVNFGICRGAGSIFYAVISSVIGVAVTGFGVRAIPLALIISYVLMCLSVFIFPSKKMEISSEKKEEAASAGFFQRNKGFIWVMIACTCVYISHVLLNNYIYQIVVSKGGNSSQMGFTMTLACCMELPMMFIFTRIMKWFKLDVWIIISALGFTLKALFTLLAPNIMTFYMAQVFQFLGWGIFAVALVYYVHQIVDPEDESKGQAYITMTYSIATVFASFIGGVIIERISVNAMILTATIAGAVGTLIQIMYARSKKN